MRFGRWELTLKRNLSPEQLKETVKIGDWVVTPDKYLSKQQALYLLKTTKRKAELARVENRKTAIRDYFVIHLGLTTGLRVMEMANLRCGDLFLDEKMCSVLVSKGKGGKRRVVYFTGPFRKHCMEFLEWKQYLGESIEPEAPLLVSTHTKGFMTTRALQKIFKRSAKKAQIEAHYSIHCLRHTYACFLYVASGNNLRLVQKQLGHSKITTTQVYVDVMMPQTKMGLYEMYW